MVMRNKERERESGFKELVTNCELDWSRCRREGDGDYWLQRRTRQWGTCVTM